MFMILALIAHALAANPCQGVDVDGTIYDLSGLDSTFTDSTQQDTPPSKTTLTWYINPCGGVEESLCPKGSYVCGVRKVELDGKEYVTEVIPIAGADDSSKRQVFKPSGDTEGARLHYSGTRWGDIPVAADLTYRCASEERTVSIEWSGAELKLEQETPAACKDASHSPPKDRKPNDGSGGWGFFGWMFFLIFLAFFGFVGLTVVRSLRMHGDIGPVGDVVRELPFFLRELWTKITGSFTTQRNGGYSAV